MHMLQLDPAPLLNSLRHKRMIKLLVLLVKDIRVALYGRDARERVEVCEGELGVGGGCEGGVDRARLEVFVAVTCD